MRFDRGISRIQLSSAYGCARRTRSGDALGLALGSRGGIAGILTAAVKSGEGSVRPGSPLSQRLLAACVGNHEPSTGLPVRPQVLLLTATRRKPHSPWYRPPRPGRRADT